MKIESLTPGTLPKLNFAFHERNLNQGYVLVEPSHTKLNLLATKKKGGGGGAKVQIVHHVLEIGGKMLILTRVYHLIKK